MFCWVGWVIGLGRSISSSTWAFLITVQLMVLAKDRAWHACPVERMPPFFSTLAMVLNCLRVASLFGRCCGHWFLVYCGRIKERKKEKDHAAIRDMPTHKWWYRITAIQLIFYLGRRCHNLMYSFHKGQNMACISTAFRANIPEQACKNFRLLQVCISLEMTPQKR